jgi:peptide/nickel transport system permease protein
MAAYAVRRLFQFAPTLLIILLLTFTLSRLTGDPARLVLGLGASEEAVQQFRRTHGLDQPVPVQFLRYVLQVLQGDLGVSLRYQEPVLQLFLQRLPATLQLGLSALLLSSVSGVAAGVYCAVSWGTLPERFISLLVLVGQAVPGFLLGLLAILLFALHWRLLPAGGHGGAAHLLLPTLTLGLNLMALTARFSRSALLEVLSQDYVRTARAKGLAARTVLYRHALRNALVPILTLVATQSAVLFSGAVVTETVFSWPGIGRFAVEAILSRDFPVIQGTVLILTVLVLLVNLVVDLSYGLLDPRIRYT